MDSGFLLELFVVLAICVWSIVGHFGNRNRYARWGFYFLCVLFMAGLGLRQLSVGLGFLVYAEWPDAGQWLGMALDGLKILLCGLLLIPPARRRLFEKYGFSASSAVHMMAGMLYIVFLLSFVQSLIFYDFAAMLAALRNLDLIDSGLKMLSLELLLAVAGGGLFVARNPRQWLDRLGLKTVSPPEFVRFVFTGVAMAALFVGLENLLRPVFPEDFARTDQLIRAMMLNGNDWATLAAVLLVSTCAGVGEEILFRGLLQPVFGIVATCALFTLVHFYYGPSVTLVCLFGLSLVFGWLRNRYSTTAAIIAHAVYDICVFAYARYFL